MANYTKHYNLKKPAQGDFYDIGDHNGNADIIDEELHKHEEKISGLTSPEFDDYESEDPETPVEVPDARTAIAGIKKGLKLSVILSKAKAAFMGLVTLGEIQQLLVNNGLCAEPGKFFMDAAFGKTLQDQVTQLYGNIMIHPNTVITYNVQVDGFMTTGNTDIVFSFPIGKILSSDITKCTIESGMAMVRQNGKYILGSGDERIDLTKALTVIRANLSFGTINVTMTRSATFEDAINNDCCAIDISGMNVKFT